MPLGIYNHTRGIPVDVWETPKDFVVKAELPFVETPTVKFNRGYLYIEAEPIKDTEPSPNNIIWHVKELHSSSRSYFKVIRFPTKIVAEGIDASYENSILMVVLPKENVQTSIKVKASSDCSSEQCCTSNSCC